MNITTALLLHRKNIKFKHPNKNQTEYGWVLRCTRHHLDGWQIEVHYNIYDSDQNLDSVGKIMITDDNVLEILS